MKIGTEDRKKSLIAAGLLIVAAFLVFRAFQGGEEPATSPPTVSRTAPSASTSGNRDGAKSGRKGPRPLLAQTLDPTLRFDLLKSSEDVAYQGTGRDIFRSQAPMTDIPKPVPADIVPSGPPVPPPPPPIPLKFYGFASRKDGNKRIFLSKGEDIFVAREGDTVDRRYKVVHIGPNSVDVQDVLTNNTQTLPLTLS